MGRFSATREAFRETPKEAKFRLDRSGEDEGYLQAIDRGFNPTMAHEARVSKLEEDARTQGLCTNVGSRAMRAIRTGLQCE